MASPLAHVPGLAGYLQQQQMAQQQEQGQLQQFGQVIGIQQAMQQQQAMKAAQAQEAQLVEVMRATGGDPEKAASILIQSGNTKAAAALAPLIEQQRKAKAPLVTPAGSEVRVPGQAPYRVPTAEPELIRLQKYLEELPAGDPRRSPVERRTKMLGERPSGMSVYTGSPVAGVDDQGNNVFFQPSQQPGVPARVIPGVRPAPKAGDEGGLTPENAGKVAMAQQAIEGVDTVSGLLFDKDGNLNKGLVLAMSVPGTTGLPGNTNARIARSAIRNAVEAKLRMETGAAATEPEIVRTLDRFMPTVGDTKDSAKFKLKELQDFFRSTLSQVKGMKATTPKRIKFDAQGNPVQ